MPQVTFDKRTLDKVSKREGIYSSLNDSKKMEIVVNDLKKAVTKIVEQSFRDYCAARAAPESMVQLEWKRFNKFLQRNL